MSKFAHEMLAQVAKEMAAAWYEEAAHDNDFYKHFPKQNVFVKKSWKYFIDMAKQQLTLMLGRTDVEEYQKELIFDALVKHASLPGNVDPRVAKQLVHIEPNSFGVH